jgi:hypothetical protein
MFAESMLAPKELQYFMNILEKTVAERRQSDKVSSIHFCRINLMKSVVLSRRTTISSKLLLNRSWKLPKKMPVPEYRCSQASKLMKSSSLRFVATFLQS